MLINNENSIIQNNKDTQKINYETNMNNSK